MADELKVSVSEDRMSAFVRLPTDSDVTMQDLRDALAIEGVRAGISAAALRDAVRGRKGIYHQIAWGVRPEVSTRRAPVVVRVFPDSKVVPAREMRVDAGFRAAWKRLCDNSAVSAGDVLAYMRNADTYPKTLTVTGDEVSSVEFPASLRPGGNTRFSRDGTSIIATRSGIPYEDGGILSVLDHMQIQGDIGSQSGDVSFPGDLSIRGDVQAGYRVFASGNILVSGSLWGSATARGRVIVSGGINAPGETVESGEGVSCRFCENSVIRSSGPISVAEAIIHSLVESDTFVRADGSKGKIVGGLVRATEGVIATTAGTPMGIPTVVEVGISPKVRNEQRRLERKLEKVRTDLGEAERLGQKPLHAKNDYDALRLSRMKRLWQKEEAQLTNQLKVFNESLSGHPKGYFEAWHVLPGVRLVMGTEVMEFTSPIDRLSKGAVPREAD